MHNEKNSPELITCVILLCALIAIAVAWALVQGFALNSQDIANLAQIVIGVAVVGTLIAALNANRIARIVHETETRAWLVFEDVAIERIVRTNGSLNFHISYKIRNIGKTPAFSVADFCDVRDFYVDKRSSRENVFSDALNDVVGETGQASRQLVFPGEALHLRYTASVSQASLDGRDAFDYGHIYRFNIELGLCTTYRIRDGRLPLYTYRFYRVSLPSDPARSDARYDLRHEGDELTFPADFKVERSFYSGDAR